MQNADTSNVAYVRDRRAPTSVVVVGSGTGGPQALAQLLPLFPAAFPGTIVVVQQMRPGFTRVLANHLNELCNLPVYEPVDGQRLHASETLLVPAGMRFTIATHDASGSSMVNLDDIYDSPESLQTRTNDAMESVAGAYGRDSIGVLLTGMGDDGRDGMRAVADAGGATIAQDEESSVVFDLPSSAIDGGAAHQVLPLWSIADHIIAMVMGEQANADAA